MRDLNEEAVLSQLKVVGLGGNGQGKPTALLSQFKASNGAARGLLGEPGSERAVEELR